LAEKSGAAATGVDVNNVADTVGAVTTEDIVSTVSNNDLTNLVLDNTASTTPIAGTTSAPVVTTGTSGTSTFLDTYVAPKAAVFPTYTADTVYQPLPDPAAIYAAGETALDTEFRASAPRTASYNPQTGAFQGYDYTTAAKLLPATGSGMSFTPPSVTSRPRQLLSAAASQPNLSASQRFARARQAQQANLIQAFSDTGAKRNSANYYDWMNQIRSGMFNNAAGQFDNQLFLNAFNPWAASQTSTGATTTTTGDALAAADPYTVNAVNLEDFTGFDNFNVYSKLGNSNQTFNTEVDAEGRPFAGGGYVKKSRGTAREMLSQFAEGGEVSQRTDFSEFAGSGGSYDPDKYTPAQIASNIAFQQAQNKAAYERAKNLDFSKYYELRDLWNMHPQNTQGIAGQISSEQVSSAYNRFNELSQQLSDDLGGQNTLEAFKALGILGGVDPEAAQKMMDTAAKRKNYLADPNRNHQAFETSGYRGAAVFAGDREANLDFLKANRLANLAGQFGTPEEINFYRKLADQEELKGTKFYETGGRSGLPTPEEINQFGFNSFYSPSRQYGTPQWMGSGYAGGSISMFAEGGPVKKPRGSASSDLLTNVEDAKYPWE
jgi:hypothetical protein